MEEKLRIYREISELKNKHNLFTIGDKVYYVIKVIDLIKPSLEVYKVENIEIDGDFIWCHLINDKNKTYVRLRDLYKNKEEAIDAYNKMLLDTLVYLEENYLKDEIGRLSLVLGETNNLVNDIVVSQGFLEELVFKVASGLKKGYSLKESVEIFYNEIALEMLTEMM